MLVYQIDYIYKNIFYLKIKYYLMFVVLIG